MPSAKHQLHLRRLELGDEPSFLRALEDWSEADRAWFTWHWEPGVAFSDVLLRIDREATGSGLPEHLVPATMYYAFLGDQIVGRLHLRHRLNQALAVRGGLSEQQRRDLEGNYRILVKQLAVRDQTKKALAEGKVEWGILPLYHRDPVEVAAGVIAPIVSGSGDHRVVVFANYHCPVCGSLWAKLDELASKSNGKTSIHLRYFVQEGDAWIVKQTAMAGYCLDEQKKLSEFHRSMRERAPVDEADLLKRVSEIPGFAQARFENCWKARLTEQKLERDVKDGQALGLSGQAIAVVNGIPIQAQEPLSEYLILIRQ